MMPVKYAVRKVGTKFDYIPRWCVVAITASGYTSRIRNTTSADKEEVIEDAAERNAKLTKGDFHV